MPKKITKDWDAIEDSIVEKIYTDYMNSPKWPLADKLDVITMLRTAYRKGQEEGKTDTVPTYRLKHIPTGLYYSPVRKNGNLTKIGKVYVRKPNIGTGIYCTIRVYRSTKGVQTLINHFKIDTSLGYTNKRYFVPANEWEVIQL